MIYTRLAKKAMNIAYNAHHGQFDKCGVPYIYHPVHLAEQMDDEASTCVALLHDVIEDTPITFEDLEKEGYNSEILEALRLLTHDAAVPYMDYVKNIKTNPIATKVKLADLRHNSDWTRLGVLTERDKEREAKYKEAIKLLEE